MNGIESEDFQLMRIYLNEKDRFEGILLYKKIVSICIQLKIVGATVIRGIYGYGNSHVIHHCSIVDLCDDLPIIVEIVDKSNKIEELIFELRKYNIKINCTLEKIKYMRV